MLNDNLVHGNLQQTYNEKVLPVICLGGPTGCGKTSVAVEIAHELNAEIINSDSRQVYQDFPIITAQPVFNEQKGIPHHLYGFLPCNEKISAGQWSRIAYKKAIEVLARGKVPLIVGGTGFYFQSLLRGIAEIPPIPLSISQNLVKRLKEEGVNILYAELKRFDSVYANRIHPNDSQRIMRAYEVWEATGKTFSWWHANTRTKPFCCGPLIVIDEMLSSLEPALLQRIDAMLANGAIEEALKALEKYPEKDAPAWNGIGCAELYSFLHNEINLDECRSLWYKNTRAYAKRQRTWFHGRKEAIFISATELDKALLIARKFLSTSSYFL